MSPVTIVLLVILAVLIAATIALYFLGKKAQKRKDEQDAQLAATAQTVTMLIIDKKRMRLNQSGLPQAVIDQTPKLMRRSKLPIVKAKVGPKVMTLIADDACFDMIPVKKEVKATVSGIYITKVTGVRGPLEKPEGKVSWRTKLKRKAESANKELQKEKKSMNGKGFQPEWVGSLFSLLPYFFNTNEALLSVELSFPINISNSPASLS